ncbi:MAG: ABC transporter permease subunit [Akkermansia sp.]|nr:ABC transporter permease subunit [Akkermansia sp.]
MSGLVTAVLSKPARIGAVAGATLTQLVRMKLFLVPAAFAVLVLALQFIPYQDGIGIEFQGVAQLELLKDVALGCMQVFGLVFSIAATALLIPRDAEDRILYTILCKPVPRFDYLAGKLLGVWGLIILMVLFMDGLMVLLVGMREAGIAQDLTQALAERGYTAEEMAPYLDQVSAAGNDWNTQRGIAAMLMNFGVLTSLTLLISCFTSGSIVSIIFSLGAYIIGMFQGNLFSIIFSGQGVTPLMQQVETAFAVLIPNFSIFAVADSAAAGAPLGWGLLGSLALIAGGYMLLHLLTAAWLFQHKEF